MEGRAEVREVFGLPGDERSRDLAARAGAGWTPVDRRVLVRLSTTRQPQSPVAVFVIPRARVRSDCHLLVAWGIGDPGNAGTLIRTAAAFEMGFVAGPGTADPWSPKVLRAAAGGHFRTSVVAAEDLEGLRALGRPLIATVVAGGDEPAAVSGAGPVAVVVGEEAGGLPTEVIAAAERRVTIPMPGGAESLNAAVAGAIVAYELTRKPGH